MTQYAIFWAEVGLAEGNISSKAVETFQVLNDTLSEAMGTAERLRRAMPFRAGNILRRHTVVF